MLTCNGVDDLEGTVLKRNADLGTADKEERHCAVIHGPAEHTAGVDACADLTGFLCGSQILGSLIQNSLEVLDAGVVVAPLVESGLGVLDPGIACKLCDLVHDEPCAAVAAQALPAGEIIYLAIGCIAMDLNDFFAKGIHDALTVFRDQIVERHQVAIVDVRGFVNQPSDPCKVNAFAGSQNLRELFAVLVERDIDELHGGVGDVLLELLIESGPDLVGVGLLASAGDHELNGFLLKRGLLFRLLLGLFCGGIVGVVVGSRLVVSCGGVVCGSLSGLAAACQNKAQNHEHGKKQAESSLFHFALLNWLCVLFLFLIVNT